MGMKTPTLWLGMWYGISGVSDGLFTTVALWAIQRTGTSPWLITLSGLSLVAPRFVLMYLGKLIDRSGPAPAFVVLNGLGLLTIGATILFSQHPVVVKGLVLGALFLITTLWQEVRLTGKAIVAAEASSAQKVKLNGRLFAVQNGCFLAGFGIAAVLFLYRDWFHAAMVIELGLLILGLFNLVPILQAPALRRSTHVPPSGSSPNLRYFFDTLKRLWRMPLVRWVLILALLANMSLAPLAVGLPTLVRSRIGAYGTLYSLISAARPVGNIIAVLGSELGAHYSALLGSAAGGIVMGVGYGFLGFLTRGAFFAAGVGLLLAGLGNFFVEAYLTAYWQAQAPASSRAQFLGSLMLLFAIAHPVGLLLYGVLGSSITVSQLFLIGGMGEVVFGLGVLLLGVRVRRSQPLQPESDEMSSSGSEKF